MLGEGQRCAVKEVSPMTLFNLPLSKYYLVLDCRSKEEFGVDHIGLSFPFPPLEESEKYLQTLLDVSTRRSELIQTGGNTSCGRLWMS